MHTHRLQDLSNLLKDLADQRHRARLCGLRVESACRGVAANAIETAAAHLAFQQEGFRLERTTTPHAALIPKYLGYDGWTAVERFFELDAFHAELIFAPESYDEAELCDPGAVARRIDWVLEPCPAGARAEHPATASPVDAAATTEDADLTLVPLQFVS
jgi:hypothetical protein